MSTKQPTPEDLARDYIDSIIAINRKHGMQHGAMSQEVYDEAVTAASDAYRHLGATRARPARN
jgi:hypothetical protein